MKKFVYSIYDKVGQVYHNPWIESSDATAARAFTFACSEHNSLYGMCPADFILFRVGSFDDVSGVFSPDCVIPEKVCDGFSVEVHDDE